MPKTQILYIHGGDTFRNRKGYLHFLKTRKVSIEEKIRWHGDNLTYRNFDFPRHSESRLRAMTPKILVLWRDEESPGARDGQGIAR